MTRFIHTGDIHLGFRFTNVSFGPDKGRRRREELWSTFTRLISYAMDENIDVVMISGDLLEEDNFTRKDMYRLSELFRYSERIKFVIIAGNHDILSFDSLLSNWEFSSNVTVLKGTEVQSISFYDLGLTIHGVSWKKSVDPVDLLKSLQRVDGSKNILMLHGDVLGASKYMALNKNHLETLGMDYIALGHIHKPMFVSENIAYCGSLEGLDFGETGERGFILGELDRESMFQFIPFSLRSFHIHQLKLKGDMSLSEITEMALKMILDSGKENFHRIVLSGYSPLHFKSEALVEQLVRDCYHLEIMDRSSPDIDLKELQELNNGNLIGAFIKSFSEDELASALGRKALFTGLEALLEGGTADVDKRG